MPSPDVSKFLVAIHRDAQLEQEVAQALRDHGASDAAEAVVAIGGRSGYTLTVEEAMVALAALLSRGVRALDEAELERVSGGGSADSVAYWRTRLGAYEKVGDDLTAHVEELKRNWDGSFG